MESTITCLPCDSYLSGTKANDLNTPLPTPATNTSLSFFLLGWSHREQREEGDQLGWSHHESPWESSYFYSLSSSTFSSFSFSFYVYGNLYIYIYSCFGYGLLLDIIRRKWNWSDYFCLCTLHFSTFFGHTHYRPILKHDIHNKKPTNHCKATNFRAWDPLSNTKSQHKFTGYKITNTNPHFLINAFRILDHNHNSQLIHRQDL